MAVIPELANPIPKAAIPYSHKGVLNTLDVPYFSFKSTVHLNTPPNLTSSPKIKAESSVAKAISNALFTA